VSRAGRVGQCARKGRQYLVKGKRVTGFTNAEEEAVGLTAVVPFLLEDRLKERGSIYSKTNWVPYVQVDGARDRTESGIFGTRSGRVAEAASLCLS